MQDVVGIICEYNPFHKGHKYQIDQVKSEFPDSIIVAIMSGNIVQRGEFAVTDKYNRAEIALECGADAVFELPYPYSGSTAEIFAKAGVELAHKLSCDYLYFGTEELTLTELTHIAEVVDSNDFEDELREILKDKSISYISAKEKALESLGISAPKSANDMLGVEYIRAIRNKGYPMKYRTVKRVGAGYNDMQMCDHMSASAIRKHFYENGAFVSIPEKVHQLYDRIIENGDFLDIEICNKVLRSYCMLSGCYEQQVFDSNKELVSIIRKALKESVDNSAFFESLSSKTYTTARIKRSLLYSVFKITDIDVTIDYAVLLGINKEGQKLLNCLKKRENFVIITKHADSRKLTPKSLMELEIQYKVDEFYNTLLKKQKAPSEAYKRKPIIKNKRFDS